MIITKKQILIWICIALISFIIGSNSNCDAQTILISEGSIFTKGVYYDNNQTLDYIYSQPLKEIQWDQWVDDGYLGKRGEWYYIRFPEYELWNDKVICYEVNNDDLKWFNGKKNFGWDKNDKVEPIEVHYREYRFRIKDGDIIEKEKGVLLKNKSNGHQDLKDIIYNGLKGVTIAFENRVKPKPKIK